MAFPTTTPPPSTSLYPSLQESYDVSTDLTTAALRYGHNDRKKKMRIFIVVSIALVAIAAIAAYFCLSYGFNMLNMARTSLQEVGGGTLVYMGAVFSGVAVINFLYAGVKVGCQRHTFYYGPRTMKKQILVSLFAPVAAIPFALYSAVGVCVKR